MFQYVCGWGAQQEPKKTINLQHCSKYKTKPFHWFSAVSRQNPDIRDGKNKNTTHA